MNLELLQVRFHGSACTVTLNRPQALNALNEQMGKEMQALLKHIVNDTPTKCIVLQSSQPKAFSVGVDLKEMQHWNFPKVKLQNYLKEWQCIAQCPLPIVVKLQGQVLGGGLEIALMGDILIADESAQFAQPELSVGTIPGLGATQRLTKRIGIARTMDLVLTGRKIDAATAYDWGIISHLIKAEDLNKAAESIVQKVSIQSRALLIQAKQSIRYAENSLLDQGLQYEQNAFYRTFALKDHQEGLNAFIEKRPPNF